jgi:opacity protein-like surface antigen
MEFDAEQVPAVVGGEATFGAAEAGEAVDAAVGIARYAPHPAYRGLPARAAAPAQRPLYTYGVGLPIQGPPLAAVTGTANYRVNTSFQIIDLLVVGTAGTWLLNSFYIGDTNMWLGPNALPADMFFAGVQNRGLRFTTAKGGRDINVAWTYNAGTTTVPTLVMALKVRSYFRG